MAKKGVYMKSDKKMVLIIAGNYDQYRHSYYGIKADSIYLSSLEMLCGYRNMTLVKIGTWYEKWNTIQRYRLRLYCELHNIRIVGEEKEVTLINPEDIHKMKIFGYTLSEIKKIIDFAKSRGY